jgi:hypothetical protein
LSRNLVLVKELHRMDWRGMLLGVLPGRRGRRGAAVPRRADSSPLVHPVAEIPVALGVEGNLTRRSGVCRRSRGGTVREELVAVSGPIRCLDLCRAAGLLFKRGSDSRGFFSIVGLDH